MNLDRVMLTFAGTMVLLSAVLAHFVSDWWLLLTAFIGIQLVQSAFTGFCPPSMLLRKLGCKDSGTRNKTDVE